MSGRRRRVGDKRIDAAIDHFVEMGFKKVDIRNVVNSLLKNVYGNSGWPFLEENCYHVVQEALLEKQEQEEKLQLQVLQKKQQEEEEEEEQQPNDDDDEEAQVTMRRRSSSRMMMMRRKKQQEEEEEEEQQQPNDDDDDDEPQVRRRSSTSSSRMMMMRRKKQQEEEEEEEQQQQQQDDDDEEAQNVQEEQEDWEDNDDAQHEQEQQQDEWEEDDEAQQQEAAIMGAPSGNNLPIVRVYNEVPSEAGLAVEQTEEVVPMIIDPPAPNAALPRLAATGTGRTRRPCFGWISESESDSDYEEFLASRRQLVCAPNPGGDRAKRKRPSRWDVKTEAT